MDQTTIAILKNFSSINKYMRFNPGNEVVIFNPSIPLFAKTTVQDIFPHRFSIYDLNQLLSTIALLNDPTIEYKDKHLHIYSDDRSVNFRCCSDSITSDQPNNAPPMPETLFSFVIEKETLNECLKASSVLGAKHLEISKHGLKVFDLNPDNDSDSDYNSVQNEYKINISNVKIFDEIRSKPVVMPIEALKMIPMDYEIEVNEKSVIFINKEHDLTYYSGLVVQ